MSERERLLGNIGDYRTNLNESAIKTDVEYTSIFQANLSNDPRNSSHYFGRFDIVSSFDTSKLGLWEGGSFHTQLQAHHGEVGGLGYVSTPYVNPNTAGFMGDDLFFSSFFYAHQFEHATLLAGKLDALELLKDGTFYGGAGRYGFMNLAFAAPPSGIVPPAFLGSLINWSSERVSWSFMVFDPKNRYTDNNLSDPFEEGVSASLTASHTRKIAERTSNITLSGTYSTDEGKDLNDPLDPNAISSGKYNLRVQVSHNIYENENNPNEAWGVYARAAIADGNPNTLDGTFSTGIGGKALISSRPNDQWGVGYFYNDISNDAQESINSLPFEFSLNDEQGVEAYYSYALTPAINITADIQYIESTDSSENILLAMRANIKL